MRYVIGVTDYEFIQIKSELMWDGRKNFWTAVKNVLYDCFFEDATIINDYDKANEVLSEIQNRVSEIDFSNISILGQMIDEENNFDKAEYAKKLKIFELVPTLVED